jgi:hypothetical protein
MTTMSSSIRKLKGSGMGCCGDFNETSPTIVIMAYATPKKKRAKAAALPSWRDACV